MENLPGQENSFVMVSNSRWWITSVTKRGLPRIQLGSQERKDVEGRPRDERVIVPEAILMKPRETANFP